MNILNAIINDGDFDVVDDENGVPSIIIHLRMIDKGNIIRNDKIRFFIDLFSSATINSSR